ncbi:MAG TPA: bacteriohopanetetrol glucosamine biosynthesis glycosyltransferase HpnI [Acetobacteraceae bacterium]|nr:bacteriohopanetetrol glucosamine biosynthesis glycosyltransferase HpnI [Acetobacteraceae bacterium]
MIPWLQHAPVAFAAGMATTGIVQTLLGLAGVRRFVTARAPQAGSLPPVTILKPLHGAEPLLAEALETFFRQEYPVLQLVFGVQRGDDPAASVARALMVKYPHVDAALVVDGTTHGANGKIGNLINMYPTARHDVLIVSDSDMHVAPDYVRDVVASLEAPGVGLVTSIYIGKPAHGGLPARLGAAYINQIFASGAVMSRALGRQDCLGATMALRRATLQRAGGFSALVSYVADDGVLGRNVLALGQGIAMTRAVPATTVSDATMAALFSHELRWARTIRAMAPTPFVMSAVQFPVFWALLTVLLAPLHVWPYLLLALTFGARATSGRQGERLLGAARMPLWMVPLRDVLSMVVMGAALAGREVAWRGEILSTAPDQALVQGEQARAAPRGLAHEKG